jgi:hypothetical protein
MSIRTVGPFSSGAAVGADGAATANADSSKPFSGIVLSVDVKYVDSPPAGTTDVVVKTKGTSPRCPSVTILTLTNAAIDGRWSPRLNLHDTSGASLGASEFIAIDDYINVTIAGANAADSVSVWLTIED